MPNPELLAPNLPAPPDEKFMPVAFPPGSGFEYEFPDEVPGNYAVEYPEPPVLPPIPTLPSPIPEFPLTPKYC